MLYYFKVIALAALFGVFYWIICILLPIEPEEVSNYIKKQLLTNQVEEEYICSKDAIERCQQGDWMYVLISEVATYCHENSLRGGILLNREVVPIFNGDEQPQNVLCVYRGKPRERR